MATIRTLLNLGRAGTLPTVWSNCLAGWWLGGHENTGDLPFLFAGTTFLYLGGAFLNDAFDADYDKEYRRTRPIPAGAISPQTAWRWGLALLVSGAVLLFVPGAATGGLGLALVLFILLYDALHRLFPFSPVLLGICRFFLYTIGAAAAAHEVTGWSIWCGLALAAYVTGVGIFLRWERTAKPPDYWPVALLAVPILLALLIDNGEYRGSGLLLSAIVALWILRALRQFFWSLEPSFAQTVSDLQAGIVFVDWLAAADGPRPLSAIFIGLFLATLALQRVFPVR